MKQLDIFELANILEFELIQAKLNPTIASIMIVDEKSKSIPKFNSNKIILYNNKIKEERIKNNIIKNIYDYIKIKNESENVHLVKINNKNEHNIDIDLLIELCIRKGLFNPETDMKKVYRKCI